jgi:hypothetical protein
MIRCRPTVDARHDFRRQLSPLCMVRATVFWRDAVCRYARRAPDTIRPPPFALLVRRRTLPPATRFSLRERYYC